jgi:hypothetical protein
MAPDMGSRSQRRYIGVRSAVPLGHLGGIGLNLMPAILAPDDQPDAGGGSVAERHRRAGLGFHA